MSEVTVKILARFQLAEGFTGARGPTSKMASSRRWQYVPALYRKSQFLLMWASPQDSEYPQDMSFPRASDPRERKTILKTVPTKFSMQSVLSLEFLIAILLTFWAFLCIKACLALFLDSVFQMPLTSPLPNCDSQKSLQTSWMSPVGAKYVSVRTSEALSTARLITNLVRQCNQQRWQPSLGNKKTIGKTLKRKKNS